MYVALIEERFLHARNCPSKCFIMGVRFFFLNIPLLLGDNLFFSYIYVDLPWILEQESNFRGNSEV